MSWALIAGGSKGIGIHIAEALAKRKYNLLLVARNPEELSEAKNKLEKSFQIRVEILSCDLSLPESAPLISDYCTSKGLDINILCNSAGLGGSTTRGSGGGAMRLRCRVGQTIVLRGLSWRSRWTGDKRRSPAPRGAQ